MAGYDADSVTVEFIDEGEGASGDAVDITDFSLSVDRNDCEMRSPFKDVDRDTEYSFSVDFDVDSEGVTCPDCGAENHLPTGVFLSLLTHGPVPCYSCGYPLL